MIKKVTHSAEKAKRAASGKQLLSELGQLLNIKGMCYKPFHRSFIMICKILLLVCLLLVVGIISCDPCSQNSGAEQVQINTTIDPDSLTIHSSVKFSYAIIDSSFTKEGKLETSLYSTGWVKIEDDSIIVDVQNNGVVSTLSYKVLQDGILYIDIYDISNHYCDKVFNYNEIVWMFQETEAVRSCYYSEILECE